MSSAQFLVRNRHSNTWYGQVVVPKAIRANLDGKRLIRRSLKTTDKRVAKRRALEFWVECQKDFERIQAGGCEVMRYIEFEDVFGKPVKIDMGGQGGKYRDKEIEAAKQIHEHNEKIIELLKDHPETLKAVLSLHDKYFDTVQDAPASTIDQNSPETPTACNTAISSYITKLETQGRNGKRLSPKTLLGYKGRLKFWGEVFGSRCVHEITRKEIADIQLWMNQLPTNYLKKGITTCKAIELAQSEGHKYPTVSDVTRADYLGQLKGFLEYAFASGYIKQDMARHVEIPNTKQSRTVHRLPFTNDDLRKIFNAESYGKDFYKKRAIISGDVKFWMPLLAVFTGARLEELAQLNVADIQTDTETGIVYLNITDKGVAGDGIRKQIKNVNSLRPIPVHSTLIKIGFLDYVVSRKSKALFDLKRDKQGRLGKGFSNWFSRLETRPTGQIKGYIEKCGVESKGLYDTGERWTKTFHSFRHTVIDNLRGGKFKTGEFIREEDIALVVGHEKGKKQTADYGLDRSQLELRKAVIETIDYKEIDFARRL